jgi:hypothetical protein
VAGGRWFGVQEPNRHTGPAKFKLAEPKLLSQRKKIVLLNILTVSDMTVTVKSRWFYVFFSHKATKSSFVAACKYEFTLRARIEYSTSRMCELDKQLYIVPYAPLYARFVCAAMHPSTISLKIFFRTCNHSQFEGF